MKCIPAFFHPTTILILDDDTVFSNLLADQLPRRNRYEVLERHSQIQEILASDCLPGTSPETVCSNSRQGDASHYSTISTAVVDYHLGEYDGVEICRTTKNAFLKKIVISNLLSIEDAISSQNRRHFDFFASKVSAEFVDELAELVERSKFEYFLSLSTLMEGFSKRENPLTDPAYCAFFLDVMAEKGAVEYYTRDCSFGSAVLIDENKKETQVFLSTDAELSALLDSSFADAAPKHVIDQIVRRERMPCFVGQIPYGDSWENKMRPIRAIDGRQRYYVATCDD